MSPSTGRAGSASRSSWIVVGCLRGRRARRRHRLGRATRRARLVVARAARPGGGRGRDRLVLRGGHRNPGGRADERIFIANVDREGVARARITRDAGPRRSVPKVHDDRRRRRDARDGFRVADILPIAEPGVLVEVTGARAVVTHSITGNGDAGVGPCARDASPAVALRRGHDGHGRAALPRAVQPVRRRRDRRHRLPDRHRRRWPPRTSRASSCPAHSRVTVPVHDYARRDDARGDRGHVRRRGRRRRRAVAGARRHRRPPRPRALARRAGALDPVGVRERRGRRRVGPRRWWSPTRTPVPTNATIRTRLDGGALEPETVSIPARTVGRGGPRPAGARRASASRSGRRPDPDRRRVARSRSGRRSPTSQRGIATTIGSTPRRRVGGSTSRPGRRPALAGLVAVLEPGRGARSTFRLRVLAGGRRHDPARRPSGSARRRASACVLDLGAARGAAGRVRDRRSTRPAGRGRPRVVGDARASRCRAPSPTSTADPRARVERRRPVIATRIGAALLGRGGRCRDRPRAAAQGDGGADPRHATRCRASSTGRTSRSPRPPWLVALFSSRTCDSCASMREQGRWRSAHPTSRCATSSSPPTRDAARALRDLRRPDGAHRRRARASCASRSSAP